MLFKFYQNVITAIDQCVETIQLAFKPAPVLVRIRTDGAERSSRHSDRRQRALNARYRP